MLEITKKSEFFDIYNKREGWSQKYKKTIDCSNPKGFSQKAHCAGRKKKESVMKLCQHDECAQQTEHIYEKKDACYTKVKSRYDVWPSAYASGALVKCRKVGAKNWGNSKKESVDEAVYQFKSYTNTQMDELDAELRRGGFRGTPDFNKMTYTTDEISSKLDKIVKRKGGKKIKESVNERDNVGMAYKRTLAKVELKKIKDAILMFQKKIKKQGRVTNARDEDHLKNLIKVYKQMGGKGVKESVDEACWVGYKQVGMKDKSGKQVPNCVKEVYDMYWENSLGESCGYTFEFDRDNNLKEAEYQGRKVKLGKPMQGDAKKFKVYVKNDKGNVVKVNFGQGGDAKGGTMRIRKNNPKARKSFRARHNCDTPGPRHKARYWSCRKW